MHTSPIRAAKVAAAFSLTIPLLLIAAACSTSDEASADPSSKPAAAKVNPDAPLFSKLPKAVQEKGFLNVASNVEYPPFESYSDDNTTIVGIDREIADALEEQFGVPIVFNNVSFDSIIPGLAAKRYDLAMSAMSDTVVRQQQVDFLDYYQAGGAIMLPPNSDGSIKSLDDLCGKNVAIVKGTTEVENASDQSEKCVAAGKDPVESTIFPGQSETVLAISSGRADAGMVDFTTGSYVATTSDTGITMLPPYEKGAFGIVFPKGDTELINVFKTGMQTIKDDGTYLEILTKHGQELGAIDEFTVNGIKE